MDTRLKLLALACAAPLALAACDGAQEDQQVGQIDEPVGAPPPAMDDTAGVTEPERQAAEAPPAAGEPAAPPEQDLAQAPQQETEAMPPAGTQVDFTGNWAMQGEGCPGEWQFTEQTVELPGEGAFQIQEIEESADGVELEVTSMTGEQTQRLALAFDDPQQPQTMVVRNGGEEIALERCQ